MRKNQAKEFIDLNGLLPPPPDPEPELMAEMRTQLLHDGVREASASFDGIKAAKLSHAKTFALMARVYRGLDEVARLEKVIRRQAGFAQRHFSSATPDTPAP